MDLENGVDDSFGAVCDMVWVWGMVWYCVGCMVGMVWYGLVLCGVWYGM